MQGDRFRSYGQRGSNRQRRRDTALQQIAKRIAEPLGSFCNLLRRSEAKADAQRKFGRRASIERLAGGDDDGVAGRTRIALQVMVLTFTRTTELRAAQWSEFEKLED